MKKIIIFVSLLVLVDISCSKKDDPAPSLVGTWTYSKSVLTGCDNTLSNGTSTCTVNCPTLIFTDTQLTYGTDVYTYTTANGVITGKRTGSSDFVIKYSISEIRC